MNRKIRTITLFISVLLLLAMLSQPMLAVQSNVNQPSAQSPFNKLHVYLGTKPEQFHSEKAVDNHLTETIKKMDEKEPLYMMVEFHSDYMNTGEYQSFAKRFTEVKSADERFSLRKEANVFSKEYHSTENQKHLSLLESFHTNSVQFINYAPFIRLEIKKEQMNLSALKSLLRDKEVANVSLHSNVQIVPTGTASWTNTLKAINAYSTVSSGLYNGTGVKVGIFEANGICDTTQTNLSGKNITIDSNCITVSNHATEVTSVAALIAPNANYYVSSNHLVTGLEWFINNDCDVVNCSFEHHNNIQNNDGTYSFVDVDYNYAIDGVYDYQMEANFISCVVAAGNVRNDNTDPAYNPYGQIRSPGLAYNAITVGGLERKITLLSSYLEYHNGASYSTYSTRVKPEISAVYALQIPNIGSVNGTSYAAPQVTGCIALFLHKNPVIAATPHVIKAVVIASGVTTANYSATMGYFDVKVGAGSINFMAMRNMNRMSTMTRRIAYHDSPNTIIDNNTVSLSANETFQAAMVWFANANLSLQQTNVTNYDLRLYDSTGNLVASSALGNYSNVEFIRYQATSAGTYTLSVYQNGNMQNATEYVGLAYID